MTDERAAIWQAVARLCGAISAQMDPPAIVETAVEGARQLPGVGAAKWRPHDAEPAPSTPGPSTLELSTPHGVLELRCSDPGVAGELREPCTVLAQQLEKALDHAATYTSLEELVAKEMTHAVEQEQAIRLVLDSMREGLIVCSLDGRLTATRSAVVSDWLGQAPDDVLLWQYLFTDPTSQQTCQLAFEQIAEDVLPFEVSASLMPERVQREERVFALGYRQVHREGRFSELLVTLDDITLELARKHAEDQHRELPGIVGHLVRDRQGFRAFLEASAGQIAAMTSESDHVELVRTLHTLKGNSALYGMASFARLVHEVEDRAVSDEAALLSEDTKRLEDAWQANLELLKVFLEESTADEIHLAREEYDDFVDLLFDASPEELAERVRLWPYPRVGPMLTHLAQQAHRIAKNLGKVCEVNVTHDGLRVPERVLRPLLGSLVHVVRNAVEHGLESPEERRAAGKRGCARIEIAEKLGEQQLTICIADDGRGIDWSAIQKRAKRLGLRCATHEERVTALFHDGLSTRERVTEISGRGVGLAACRHAWTALGGTVEIESTAGHGTKFRFSVPLQALQA